MDARGVDAACVADEHEANLNELAVWEALVGARGKPGAAHEYEQQLNRELAGYQRSPERFARGAVRRHAAQCRE